MVLARVFNENLNASASCCMWYFSVNMLYGINILQPVAPVVQLVTSKPSDVGT